MNPGPSRLRALLEVFLFSGFPTQAVIGLGLGVTGLRPGKDGALSLSLLATLAGLDSIVLIWLVLGLLRSGGESPRQVLLGPRPIGLEMLRGLVLVPWIFGIVIAVGLTIARWAPQLIAPNPLASVASTCRCSTAEVDDPPLRDRIRTWWPRATSSAAVVVPTGPLPTRTCSAMASS